MPVLHSVASFNCLTPGVSPTLHTFIESTEEPWMVVEREQERVRQTWRVGGEGS